MTAFSCCHGTEGCEGQGDKHWCRKLGEPSREGLLVALEISTKDNEALTKENEGLRSALARSERERAAYLEALTETQTRCTELREELRRRA
jgi:hypothetical protein